MDNRKIALLVDVDNVKIGGEAFNELYAKLNEIGDVVYCKFYGYNDRKHIYLSDAIARYGYETAPFMRYKKRFSQLDMRIVVDAIKLNYTKTEIDTYCIIAGDGDLIPLLVELKSCGRFLIDINTPYQEQNTHMFDAHIKLTSLNDDVETYVPKTKKVAKAKKQSPIVIEKKEAPVKATTKTTRVVETEEYEEVSHKLKEAQMAKAAAAKKAEKEAEGNAYADFTDVSDVLNDIVERYNELDFMTNDDMDKKVQLIKDMETFVNSETAKGGGLKSDNDDVRQIFVDLKNLANDMKNQINQ